MGHAQKTPQSGEDITHNNPKVMMDAIATIASMVYVRDDFDIPYVAGMSRSGIVYYRDRHMPATWQYRGRSWPVDTPLITHEWVEFLIENKGGLLRDSYLSQRYQETGDRKFMLGPDTTFDYALSHQLAQHLERFAVIYMVSGGLATADGEADQIWDDWSVWCDQWIKTAASEQITRCPADLYLQPYEDDGADIPLLKRIADAGGPKSYLLYDVGQVGGSDGYPFYEGG